MIMIMHWSEREDATIQIDSQTGGMMSHCSTDVVIALRISEQSRETVSARRAWTTISACLAEKIMLLREEELTV